MNDSRHVGYDDLPWVDIGDGWERATVELKAGETAWNPVSTKHVIYGPETITYERGPSRSVTAIVGESAEDRVSNNPLFVAAERDLMENG